VEADCDIAVGSGFRVRYCRRNFRHSISSALLEAMPEYLRWADVVHLTGVYNFPTLPTLLGTRSFRKPLVWSPRGALQRWQGSRRRRMKGMWERVCGLVAGRGVVLHVTSEEEARESAERIQRPTALIPNGIEIPAEITRASSNGALRLLYMGRLDPKKGIENLLSACSQLPFSAWRLTIAGGGEESYADSLRRQVRELRLESRVEMPGEVSGAGREELFAKADLCVVPSHTENFGMVVAEALARAVPVIASRGTPWSKLEEQGCGIWTSNDPESLTAAIARLRSAPLQEMGDRGRRWMAAEFSWSSVGRRMHELYLSLLRESAR
jgi:glycosyltransferase involved in cell wall biosynthesis